VSHAAVLTQLADRLRELAALPAEEALVALGPWLDRSSPERAELALLRARQLAAREAVRAAGSQAAVIAATGMPQGRLSRLVTGAY
jgi:hypothetical protein